MTNNKNESINSLLSRLNLKKHGWIVVDNWDSDQCAIGIAKSDNPRHLVYVSTFGKDNGFYDYECEVPTGSDPTDYATSKMGKNVGFDEFLKELQKHLS